MQEILLKLRYYQKALKKLTLFFLLNSVSFNVQNYQKQKGSGTSDQLFFRLQIGLEKFLYPKITFANLCQPIHDIINYFTSF